MRLACDDVACVGVEVEDPVHFLAAYLERIARGDVSAVKEHFDPRASAFYVQDRDLIAVSLSDLVSLIDSWGGSEPHDPMVEVYKLHEGQAFAVLIARFTEPHGVRFGSVFNLYRSNEGWKIWSANGRPDYLYDHRVG